MEETASFYLVDTTGWSADQNGFFERVLELLRSWKSDRFGHIPQSSYLWNENHFLGCIIQLSCSWKEIFQAEIPREWLQKLQAVGAIQQRPIAPKAVVQLINRERGNGRKIILFFEQPDGRLKAVLFDLVEKRNDYLEKIIEANYRYYKR